MLLPALLLSLPAVDAHPTRDLIETAVEAGSFTTLAAALEAAGLVDTLRGPGPFTILAPTDEAFAALPDETLRALLRPENRGALTEILTLHVVSGDVSASDAVAAGEANALSGGRLAFAIAGGRLQVNGVDVVQNDVRASNGTIHVIGEVLLPEGGVDLAPSGRLVIGIYGELPSQALASQLGIDRSSAQLVTSIVDGGEAEKAGLRPYDVLLSFDGLAATDENLKRAKAAAGFGRTIEVVLIREGRRRTVHVGVGVERH